MPRPQSFDMPMLMAERHAEALPAFPNHAAAVVSLHAAARDNAARLDALAPAAAKPSEHLNEDALGELELWAAALTPQHLNAMGTSRAELDHLLAWHAAAVAVSRVPHAEWVVEENWVLRGRWTIGVRCGLGTHGLDSHAARPFTIGSRKDSRTPNRDWVLWLAQSVAHDPTLHPAVLPNQHRMSQDSGIRSCQTSTLAAGIDCFDEHAVVENLRKCSDSERLRRVRCLETLEAISNRTADFLLEFGPCMGVHVSYPIALLLRFRTDVGLGMAERHRELLTGYFCGPVVRAAVRVPGPRATSLLCDLVGKITHLKGSLSQCDEVFAIAVRRLWEIAHAGEHDARTALKQVGRRWKWIPPKTHETLQRYAPGFTEEVARSGGLAAAPIS